MTTTLRQDIRFILQNFKFKILYQININIFYLKKQVVGTSVFTQEVLLLFKSPKFIWVVECNS